MKKRLNNRYFLGGFTLPTGASGASAVSGGLDAIGSLIPSSGNAKTDAITNGIAGGLEAVGSAFGPLGSVIGKAAGFLTKGIGAMVGTPDDVNTDTGEYIKGKGIRGRRSRNRVQLEWRRVNQGIRDTELTAQLQEDAANEYDENDYSLASFGGTLPTTFAYLDDGEMLRSPDGSIGYIPEQGKPTDSNLMKVPVGTQVLSDKLKVPGTNQTFAEAGKKLMKKKKYGNDVFALNSQMLNERNNQRAFDDLMAMQEEVKNKRGIKRKGNSYVKGGPVRNVTSASDLNWAEDMMNSPWFETTMRMITPFNLDLYNNLQNTYPTLGFGDTKPGNTTLTANKAVGNYQGMFDNLTDMNAAIGDLYKNGRLKGRGGSSDKPEVWRDNLAGDATWLRNLGRNVTPELLSTINNMLKDNGVEAYINPDNNMVNYRPLAPIQDNTSIPVPDADLDPQSITKTSPIARVNTRPKRLPRTGKTDKTGKSSFDLGDFLAGAANLAGPIANIYDSDPEQAPVHTYTPHYGPNSYDISPIIREANLTNAIARYNNNQSGGAGRGANLAQAIQSQIVRNNAIANAYTLKANIENQYRFLNAGIYNDWARWNVENRHRGDVENAQNRAAARNIRRTGIAQLGTAIANMNRDRRLTARDRALLKYMRPYLEYGSTRDAINNLYNDLI